MARTRILGSLWLLTALTWGGSQLLLSSQLPAGYHGMDPRQSGAFSVDRFSWRACGVGVRPEQRRAARAAARRQPPQRGEREVGVGAGRRPLPRARKEGGAREGRDHLSAEVARGGGGVEGSLEVLPRDQRPLEN